MQQIKTSESMQMPTKKSFIFTLKQYAPVLALCLFVIAGVPRIFSLDAHWSSDETRWLYRSAEFMNALKSREFDQTFLAYHPGVTTMWLAGLRQVVTEDPVWASLKDLALARWFIGVCVLVGLVAVFFLLHRLLAFWPATFAWVFLAFNPFFLAQSRRVHTDALATIFILLTVLLFSLYCLSPKQRSYLIFSGITFGLACLTKSYSIILLLWGPVCLLLFRQREQVWRDFLLQALLSSILFLNCTLLTVFALWPIFWTPFFGLRAICLLGTTCLLILVKRQSWALLTVASAVIVAVGLFALQTMWEVFSSVEWALTTAHEVEHFFLGKIAYDPGWLFYPFVLSIKSTPLTIPLAILGVFWVWRAKKQTILSAQQLRIALVLLCGILLFSLCFTLTAKKFSRYLLPAFPMVDILAGLGAFYGIKAVGKRVRTGLPRLIGQIACVTFVFVLTAIPVFALHPYYGTYYNLCWKFTDITKVITIGEASGLDIAGKYLNTKPDANQMSVQASDLATEFLRYYFVGTVYRADENFNEETSELLPADYELVYIRDSQIGRVPQTGSRNGELEHTITLNGIDLVWIYRLKPKEEKK